MGDSKTVPKCSTPAGKKDAEALQVALTSLNSHLFTEILNPKLEPKPHVCPQ